MPPVAEFGKFLIAGGINTAATFLLFELLRRAIPYLYAYSVAYIAGIAISYLLNARYVFKRRANKATAVRYPLVYLVQYLIGASLLFVLVDLAAFSPTISLLVVIIVTVPTTFVLAKLIISAAPKADH